MILSLKIDVDTYRGTHEGIPALVRLLKKYQVNATFLFSLGPDHTGWALRRIFRPGFFNKVARTSVLEHYGLKTLLYGVMLPAPDIGYRCLKEMRGVRDAGFECGIHCWDHTLWQDNVLKRSSDWTSYQMQKAYERFVEIFETPSLTHGAAGWQMNLAALEQLEQWNIAYASDGRIPLTQTGELLRPNQGAYYVLLPQKKSSCMQLPTTLPTLDELLGRTINGAVIDTHNVVPFLLNLTKQTRDHVYTLHAELEGQKFLPLFEQLLIGWIEQGYQLGSLKDLYRKQKEQEQYQALPICAISYGALPGRSGQVFLQNLR